MKAARELRDRYLEEANTDGGRFALEATLDAEGKYDLTREWVGEGVLRIAA